MNDISSLCKNCKFNQSEKCKNKVSPNYNENIEDISNCNDLVPIYGDKTK